VALLLSGTCETIEFEPVSANGHILSGGDQSVVSKASTKKGGVYDSIK
jgi:hypothetical protein